MPSLPPLRGVWCFTRRRACEQPFRSTVDFDESRPAYRRTRCPWCGIDNFLRRPERA